MYICVCLSLLFSFILSGKFSHWSSEEMAALHTHFKEELNGASLNIGRVKTFLAETNMKRTAISIKFKLIQMRKKNKN